MAVGNPLGLAGTVTTGIVSALNRPVTTGGETDQFGTVISEPVVTDAIQTSAAINPGNSGGALVDAAGKLIGINSSIASLGSSQSQSGNIGIGFAIPSNTAKSVAEQLIGEGKVSHAYLGVSTQDTVATEGTDRRNAALVTKVVTGSAADKAGLRANDIVVAINGKRVDSSLSLVATVRELTSGEQATITVLRDGARVDLTATLGTRS
jgi:putative serine protease PepD